MLGLRVVLFALCVTAVWTKGIADDSTINIALLQMMPSPNGNQTYNTDIATKFITQAKQQGADIALMPELWNVGYTIAYPGYDPSDQSGHFDWLSRAVATDSDYVTHFQKLAKQLQIAIAVTYLQTWSPLPRNTVSLIDRFGNIVLTYAKIHTCDWSPAEASTFPGDDFYTATLNTAKGNITVGAMICYDREQPESARILMVKGAELIVTPNACILSQTQIDQFKVRAFENAVVVAMTNYAGPYMNGNSVAYGADATPLVQANGDEGVYMASFDLKATRAFRAQTNHGDAFRRPYRYSALTTLKKVPDFQAQNFFQRDRLF